MCKNVLYDNNNNICINVYNNNDNSINKCYNLIKLCSKQQSNIIFTFTASRCSSIRIIIQNISSIFWRATNGGQEVQISTNEPEMQAHFEKMIVELQAAQEPFKRLEMLATPQTVDTALRVSCHVRWTIQRVAVGASYGSNRVQITARKSKKSRINYELGFL